MSILKTIAHSFDEIKSILSQFDDSMYQKKIEVISNGTIGQHFRHIIEFYDCFLNTQHNHYICYDERKRELLWETSVNETLNKLDQISTKIQQLDLMLTIQLKQTYYGEEFNISSSNQRELMYCFDHSVHHFALIKIAIKTHFPMINIPQHFGIASSTIAFQNQKK